MTQITDEMKVAAVKAYTEVDGKCRPAAMQKALEAALPFLPIAVEGKVAWDSPEEWEIEQRSFHAVGRDDVPVDVQQLVAKLWAMYCHAAAPSSPGKDGGQEVEAVAKPLAWKPESTDEAGYSSTIAKTPFGFMYDVWRIKEGALWNGVGLPKVDGEPPKFDSREAAMSAVNEDYAARVLDLVETQPASTALVERLTKALEPFCKHYEPWMERWDDQEASSTFSRHTFGDLREALAAINEARSALSASTSREAETKS